MGGANSLKWQKWQKWQKCNDPARARSEDLDGVNVTLFQLSYRTVFVESRYFIIVYTAPATPEIKHHHQHPTLAIKIRNIAITRKTFTLDNVATNWNRKDCITDI